MLTKMCAAGASAALSFMWLKHNAATSPEVIEKFSAIKNPPLIFSSGNSCLSLRTAVMMDDRTAKKEHLAAQLSKICSQKSDKSLECIMFRRCQSILFRHKSRAV